MTIAFRRPNTRRSWAKITYDLSLAVAEGAATNVAGAATRIGEALRSAVGQVEDTPENRAWMWLNETVSRSFLAVLQNPRLLSPLSREELVGALQDTIAGVLTGSDTEQLSVPILYDPGSLSSLIVARSSIPGIARAVAPEHTMSDQELDSLFCNTLREEAGRVLTEQATYYGPVTELLFGVTGAPERRNFAWLRHSNWIRGLFTRQPIFSPDSNDETPLSHIYLPLRCYWHEEVHKKSNKDRDEKTHLVAHVADLHRTVHAWLDGDAKTDPIRVIAGGPGSGKSSFARGFATEVTYKAEHHVVFVHLQHMGLSLDLHAAIGLYLQRENSEHAPDGSAGLPENPLSWRATDPRPLLLVFDGLDELSHSDETSKTLARRFIFSVKNLLVQLNANGSPVRALILGRSAACQDALKEADLGLPIMLNVAPLDPLGRNQLGLSHVSKEELQDVFDENDLCQLDQRTAYWSKWRIIKGISGHVVPEAVSHESMAELNVEPLLLHLLIISEYSGERWREASENRNLVYRDIFEKIFRRNRSKELFTAHGLSEEDFFLLMECLGLAAWRGNGRTGSAEEFRKLRKLHANREKRFGRLESAELKSVALQIHARREAGSGDGFEFIHKSFGEYLAGRALLTAGLRTADDLANRDEPEDVAPKWTMLIGSAEITSQVLRFLKDEARIATAAQDESAMRAAKDSLTEFMNWTLREGLPVHRLEGTFSFRSLEARQRCAETALLCTLNALASTLPDPVELSGANDPNRINISWPDSWYSAAAMLHRLGATVDHPVAGALSRLNLQHQTLDGLNLGQADLNRADLRSAKLNNATLHHSSLLMTQLQHASLFGANLVGANCHRANFKSADLRRANMRGIDLSEATLCETDLDQADLGGEVDTMAAILVDVRDLTQEQIDSATGGSKTVLPRHLGKPEHWPLVDDKSDIELVID